MDRLRIKPIVEHDILITLESKAVISFENNITEETDI